MNRPNLWIGIGELGREVIQDLRGDPGGGAMGRYQLAKQMLDVQPDPGHEPLLGFVPGTDGTHPWSNDELVIVVDPKNERDSLVPQLLDSSLIEGLRGRGIAQEQLYVTVFVHAHDLERLRVTTSPEDHWLWGLINQAFVEILKVSLVIAIDPRISAVDRSDDQALSLEEIAGLQDTLGRVDGEGRSQYGIVLIDQIPRAGRGLSDGAALAETAELCSLLFEAALTLSDDEASARFLDQFYDTWRDPPSFRLLSIRTCGYDMEQAAADQAARAASAILERATTTKVGVSPIQLWQPPAAPQAHVRDGDSREVTGRDKAALRAGADHGTSPDHDGLKAASVEDREPAQPAGGTGVVWSDPDQAFTWLWEDDVTKQLLSEDGELTRETELKITEQIDRLYQEWDKAVRSQSAGGSVQRDRHDVDRELKRLRDDLAERWMASGSVAELIEGLEQALKSANADDGPATLGASEATYVSSESEIPQAVLQFSRAKLLETFQEYRELLFDQAPKRATWLVMLVAALGVFIASVTSFGWVADSLDTLRLALGLGVVFAILVAIGLWSVARAIPGRRIASVKHQFLDEWRETVNSVRRQVNAREQSRTEVLDRAALADYQRGVRSLVTQLTTLGKAMRSRVAEVNRRETRSRIAERLVRLRDLRGEGSPEQAAQEFREQYAIAALEGTALNVGESSKSMVRDDAEHPALHADNLQTSVAAFAEQWTWDTLSGIGQWPDAAEVKGWLVMGAPSSLPAVNISSFDSRMIAAPAAHLERLAEQSRSQSEAGATVQQIERPIPRNDKAFVIDTGLVPLDTVAVHV